MPKLYYKEKVNNAVTIGVQLRKDHKSDSIGNYGRWTARIKYPDVKGSPTYVSLGIAYKNGDDLNKRLARQAAETEALKNYEKAKRGLVGKSTAIRIIAANWLNEIEPLVEANEALLNEEPPLNPIHAVDGGRGYWTRRKYNDAVRTVHQTLNPFFKTIKAGRDEADILLIQPQDLDLLTDFMLKNPGPYLTKIGRQISPSSILKATTTLRHIYRYAYNQRLIKTIPAIKRPSSQDEERVRRPLTEKEYFAIVDYTRDKYQRKDSQGSFLRSNSEGEVWSESVDTYQDYQYLFHLWILVIANCGIRPPTSGTEHTRIKWNHFEHDKETGVTTLRRDEKGLKTYYAVIMPQALDYWEALEKFQRDRGIYKEDGYVFAHPFTSERTRGGWKKGDPITNFRGQWVRMIKDLGLNAPSNRTQADRITPYALRSWFITMRLQEGGVDVTKLSRATGTSIEMVMKHYYNYQTTKEFEHLIQGGHARRADKKPIYNPQGYYIGHEDSTPR